MNPEKIMASGAMREAAFPEVGAFKDTETKAQIRTNAYSRAKELLKAKLENLTGNAPQTEKRDHRGRIIRPKNYHEVWSAKNALLAIETGAADATVREVLAEEREKASQLFQKLNAEHLADPDWSGSLAARALLEEAAELKTALDSLNSQQI
jgi:hypothetical protein